MNIEENQHDELLSELIHINDLSQRRLKLMETIQAISIPALIITGAAGITALLKVFEIF